MVAEDGGADVCLAFVRYHDLWKRVSDVMDRNRLSYPPIVFAAHGTLRLAAASLFDPLNDLLFVFVRQRRHAFPFCKRALPSARPPRSKRHALTARWFMRPANPMEKRVIDRDGPVKRIAVGHATRLRWRHERGTALREPAA